MSDDWPFPNRKWDDGTWECGAKYAAILFKPDGSVRLIRQLEADSKSLIGHLGGMNGVVNDLLWLKAGDLRAPDILGTLLEIISTDDDKKAQQMLLEFSQNVRAGRIWIREVLTGAGPYQSFFRELKRLSEELHQPPSKGRLSKALGLKNNAARISKICRATGFDWLPKDKPGPKTSKKRR